jgi:peptide/nickel transport system permease protein
LQRFIIRRFFTSLLALAASMMVVFALSRMLGDPRFLLVGEAGYGMTKETWDKLGRELHLDKPVPVQFGFWVWNLVRGDLGKDLLDNRPVTPKLAEKFIPTLKLGIAAWILATLVGIPLGVLSAISRATPLDYIARFFALLGQALPTFWIGILAILVFAVWLGWLPVATMGEGLAIRNFILPTITLAWLPAAGYVRFTRSAMLEVLDSEYIKMARAKGVGWWSVVWKHAFKNAALIPLTATGLVLAGFITGSVLVEAVFAWPGIGFFAVQAVRFNNLNVLVAVTLFFTAIFIVVNFLVDILYAYVDPRIRYS